MGEMKKVAVVTGGSTGIGKGCVLRFLEEGYAVVTNGRRQEKLEELAAEAASEDLRVVLGDVSRQQDVIDLVEEAVSAFGRIDCLVNNAGICTSIPFVDMSAEDYDQVVSVNQYGCFYGMQAAARAMIRLGIQGVIMNVSSVFYQVASPGIFHYHASKGAIASMTKSAALELADHGIRVLAVAPGVIDTPMLDIDKERGTWEEIQKKHMRQRALTTQEVARVMVFLCSEEAYGVNGCILPIDDGLLAKY